MGARGAAHSSQVAGYAWSSALRVLAVIVLMFFAGSVGVVSEDPQRRVRDPNAPLTRRPSLPLPGDGVPISLNENGVLRIGTLVPRKFEDLRFLDNRLFPSLAPREGLAGPRYEPGRPDSLLFVVAAKASLRDFARIETVLSGATEWGDSYPGPPKENGSVFYDRVYITVEDPTTYGAIPLWKPSDWSTSMHGAVYGALRCGDEVIHRLSPPRGMGSYLIWIVRLVPLDAGGFLVSLGSIQRDQFNWKDDALWGGELPEPVRLWKPGEIRDYESAITRLVARPYYFEKLDAVAELVTALGKTPTGDEDVLGPVVDVYLLARHDQPKVPVQVLVDAMDTLIPAGARSVQLMPHFWPRKVIEVRQQR